MRFNAFYHPVNVAFEVDCGREINLIHRPEIKRKIGGGNRQDFGKIIGVHFRRFYPIYRALQTGYFGGISERGGKNT